ncbi:ammonium transporter Rh type B [Euwallacea fornicatus]|uniref:ammonium transporter Rh type B n=1 Tax=Euwallacea fornicatus TaxID=995702 RepID=UPI003390567D
MVFIGFGFLMTYLKKYGYSSLGFNFLLAALTLQWSIICEGFFELNDDYKIGIGLDSLLKADIATAAVLISMGAVLGRTSHVQLAVMGLLEIFTYCLNNALNNRYFKAVDAGGSVTVHTFGAYFGLSASYVLQKRTKTDSIESYHLDEASYASNIYAMIGSIFLWVYWPSFNSINLEDDRAHMAIINTYLSLTSCCVSAFVVSQLKSKQHKFNMVHIQNSTLAGGVAIGACAHLMIQPFGAVLLGTITGALSVYGYTTLSGILQAYRVLDTCGINNLHGIPGILGGLVSVLMASLANEEQYGKSLYKIYPARANLNTSWNPQYVFWETGSGRSAQEQAGYQALLLFVTVLLAVVSGIISGAIISWKVWGTASSAFYYNDSEFWEVPSEQTIEGILPIAWTIKEKLYHKKSNSNLFNVST